MTAAKVVSDKKRGRLDTLEKRFSGVQPPEVTRTEVPSLEVTRTVCPPSPSPIRPLVARIQVTAAKVVSDKKKGRLEALEKRFSGVQPPDVTRTGVQSPEVTRTETSDADLCYPGVGSEIQGNDATYAKLCPSVLNGPLKAFLQLRPVNDTNATLDNILTSLLEANGKFGGDVRNTIESRMQDATLLLDSRTMQSSAIERARERVRSNLAKRSRKHLSLCQHRKAGSFEVPEQFQKYSLYQELHEMWVGYVKGLITNCRESMMESRLLQADLHGASMAVVDCKNSQFNGIQGIMVRETGMTFGLMTTANKFRVIPKAGTTFRLEVENLRVTLFGNSLVSKGRTSTKQNKKRKSSLHA